MSERRSSDSTVGSATEEARSALVTQQSESDKEILHQFGYAQQLLRDMGGFSNFAISFSIISILTGAITLYGTGLNSGGPVVMGIGWPLVTLFVLCIAASMAELASAIPTSGALYHWSTLLGGPTWGWLTAWLNLIGLIAAIAGIDWGCAQFLAPLLGMDASSGSYMTVFLGLLLSQAILNHIGIRAVARLNDFSALYHLAGVAIIVIALACYAEKQPLVFLFTKTFNTVKLPAWFGALLSVKPDFHTPGAKVPSPYWFAFLGGLLQAQWTYTGYDASAHTIEETKDARVRAPWGIYLSVAVSGFFGYIMLAFITLAIKDLPAAAQDSNPVIYIFTKALGDKFGHVMLWIMTLAQWFCGLACITSTSRMIFAFSRDKGMPLSPVWSYVSRRYRTPAAAVWLAAVAAFLLPCLVFALIKARPHDLDFTSLYQAVTGISTIGLYLSYGFPLLLKLRAQRQGVWERRADGPWNLGSWSVPVAVISLVWIAFITVLFVLPPNELTGYVFGGTLVALLLFYGIAVRGRFRGPVPQATSREELLRIEAKFEGKG
jgi:amino acid transporter